MFYCTYLATQPTRQELNTENQFCAGEEKDKASKTPLQPEVVTTYTKHNDKKVHYEARQLMVKQESCFYLYIALFFVFHKIIVIKVGIWYTVRQSYN